MSLIASSLPGRLRLRAPALRHAVARRRLSDRLMALPCALGIAENPRAGSLVLTYDAGQAVLADMEQAAVEAAKTLGVLPPDTAASEDAMPAANAPAAGEGKALPSARVRLNRQAKRGMLVSLAVSMALAAAGARRWHVLTGSAFLVFLAAHLAVHRRHLLR